MLDDLAQPTAAKLVTLSIACMLIHAAGIQQDGEELALQQSHGHGGAAHLAVRGTGRLLHAVCSNLAAAGGCAPLEYACWHAALPCRIAAASGQVFHCSNEAPPPCSGKGGSYFGPNHFNFGNTTERAPKNKYDKDPSNWARAYDATIQLIESKESSG